MGIWNKTLFYLGLVDEDAAADEDYERSPARGRVEGRPDQPNAPRHAAGRRPAPVRRSEARPSDGSRVSREMPISDAYTTGERPAVARQEPQAPRGVQGRRVEPPSVGRRRTMTDQALNDSGVVMNPNDRPLVRTFSSDSDLESEVIVARSYSDAQAVADHLRSSLPVVLDLRKVEPAMVRRLVDFSSGLTYALGGSMRKIGQGVVLVTPPNVNISRDERRRLRELGYHEAPENP
ncbi:MAG: cell division protein SepF [Acidimicrobiia bacterium]